MSPSEVFKSFGEAASVCGDGYDQDFLANVNFQRDWNYYHAPASFPPVPWYMTAGIASALPLCFISQTRPLRVLDFGGSAAIHYAFAKKSLREIPIEKWAVVETAAAVRAANACQTDELRFFADIESALDWLGAPDIVTSSGAVQYTPDPIATVRRLVDIKSPILALHRCAFAVAGKVITVQRSKLSDNARGPMPEGVEDRDISYPLTLATKQDYLNVISEGYELWMSWHEEPTTVFNGINVELRTGMLFRRKA